jgi:sRNA-binding protein
MIRHRRALYNVTDEKQDGEQVTSNKQKRRADSTAVIAQLAALFPKAFAVNHHERKPLKIGIDADIVARGVAIEPPALWRPLRVYCASFGYLRTITAGAEDPTTRRDQASRMAAI